MKFMITSGSMGRTLGLATWALAAACAAPTDIGSAEGAIVNGRPAGPDEIYSTVALPVGGVGAPEDIDSCTGTLIRPNVVLTAAHCFFVDGEDGQPTNMRESLDRITVIAGPLSVFEATDEQTYNVTRIAVHPGYDHVGGGGTGLGGAVNDVALVFTDGDVTQVPVAELVGEDEITDGSPLVLAGYGSTRIEGPEMTPEGAGVLNVADVAVTGTSETEFGAVGARMMDSCPGDSGGPAYVIDGDGYRVAGVTSRADPEVESACGEGGIYANTSAFRTWIEQEVGESDAGGCSVGTNAQRAPAGIVLLALAGLFWRRQRTRG